ncbi:MAG: PA14 domain-containing protein [Acidobacteria bacterium]|nr:PA14 domain-containing protein [Acidobacteriota bacterium]
MNKTKFSPSIYQIFPGDKILVALMAASLFYIATTAQSSRPKPISLHPENPHYFLWRGKPTIIITSGEHYGAVLNLDFNYVAYLDALAQDKLNNVRIFTGAYAETSDSFNITNNVLAPAPNRLICPWARSSEPGAADGGNKFDLSKWDENYFKRLRDFVAKAGERGIVVEVNLFCPFYNDSMWSISPMNKRNNVNNVGDNASINVYTLEKHGGLLPIQEAMTRKIVAELKDFDNLYYEICNEPYFGGVEMKWQHHIADVITDAQKDFPDKFLISQNIANGSQKIDSPHPAVSIFNFHYAVPPIAVALNHHLDKVIGDNETGFRGTGDDPYRMEAWDFIVAGGALYNNLDYSFTVQHPGGTWTELPATMPGGGGPVMRRQLRLLQEFISGFDFIRMKPDDKVIKGGVPGTMTARALVERGKAYAIYIRTIPLSTRFSARWTGFITSRHSEEHTFQTLSKDRVRLWVGEQQVINNWTEHSQVEDRGTIKLEARRKYPIRLEYSCKGGAGTIKLGWARGSRPVEPIPSAVLTPPVGMGTGLNGEYFSEQSGEPKMERLLFTRTDAKVEFDWDMKSLSATETILSGPTLTLDLPAGCYNAEWVDTKSGAVVKRVGFKHRGGGWQAKFPDFKNDIALRVRVCGK